MFLYKEFLYWTHTMLAVNKYISKRTFAAGPKYCPGVFYPKAFAKEE